MGYEWVASEVPVKFSFSCMLDFFLQYLRHICIFAFYSIWLMFLHFLALCVHAFRQFVNFL